MASLPTDPVGTIVIYQDGNNTQFEPDGVSVFDSNGGVAVQGATISVGGSAEVTAEVDNVYGSAASTTTGDASATTNTSDRSGIEGAIGSGETIGIDAALIDVDGDAAVIQGTVDNESGATADAKTGDATAVDSSGLQAGIRANTLDVAGTSIITGSVSNDQEAIATSVTEDNDGATAKVRSGAEGGDRSLNADTTGVDAATMNLGGDATVTGSADVSQLAGADLTTGDASAEGVLGGDVTGVDNSTSTTANADLTVAADASVGIESIASNTDGGNATADSKITNDADVVGLNQNELTVGGDYGLLSNASATLDAEANSNGGDATAVFQKMVLTIVISTVPTLMAQSALKGTHSLLAVRKPMLMPTQAQMLAMPRLLPPSMIQPALKSMRSLMDSKSKAMRNYLVVLDSIWKPTARARLAAPIAMQKPPATRAVSKFGTKVEPLTLQVMPGSKAA